MRNKRGAEMVDIALQGGRLSTESRPATGKGSHEALVATTVESDAIVQGMIGKPARDVGMPVWAGNVLAWVLTHFVAPTGVNFARYSIDYHLLRNYLHMVDVWGPERAREAIPDSARTIVEHYLDTDPRMALLDQQVKEQTRRRRTP